MTIPPHRFQSHRQAPNLCGATIEVDGLILTCCGRPGDPEHRRREVVFVQPGDVTSSGPACECLFCRLRRAGDDLVATPVGVPPAEDPRSDPAGRVWGRWEPYVATGLVLWLVLTLITVLIV